MYYDDYDDYGMVISDKYLLCMIIIYDIMITKVIMIIIMIIIIIIIYR